MRALCCLLLLFACHPQKKLPSPATLPGLRVTQAGLCQLSYSISFEGESAQIVAARQDREAPKSYTVKGARVGASVLFTGQDLFDAPRSCQEAELQISARAAPRDQISTPLALDELLYQASSVAEAQESLWVVGREAELRMLDGAFTAVFIQEAQERVGEVSALVSEAAELFGQPSARQLWLLGSGARPGVRRWIDTSASTVEAKLALAVVSLWLSSAGARAYYSLWLQAKRGVLGLDAFAKGLSDDASAARFFCFDVLSRSRGASLSQALQTLLAARQEMTEGAVSAELQLSACLGDGLGVAAASAGLVAKRGSAAVVDPRKLQEALGW